MQKQGRDDKTEQYFSEALALDPQNAELLYDMALLYQRKNQAGKALECAIKVTQLRPRDREAYGFAGQLLLELNMVAAAEQVYRNLLLSKPDDINAAFSVIHTLVIQLKNDEAAEVARQALAVHPDNAVLQYYCSMLRGENIDRPPDEYVARVFDAYADHFDTHLQQELGYKIPSLLAGLIRPLPGVAGKSSLSLLDLGCGTGLAAAALKDVTRLRVGVDLSPKMLDKARVKRLYTELHQEDIVTFMLGSARRFDVVTATDVLIYVGDPVPFFKAARKALATGGLLAFSIENEEGKEPFRLNATGRYSHRAEYILSLAKTEGYDKLAQENAVLRLQQNAPVQGTLLVFKKTGKD